jgi:hypothetical protein
LRGNRKTQAVSGLCVALATAALAAASVASADNKTPWVGDWKGSGIAAEGEPFQVGFDVTSRRKIVDGEVRNLFHVCEYEFGGTQNLYFPDTEFTEQDRFGNTDRVFALRQTYESHLGFDESSYTVELQGKFNKKYTAAYGHLFVYGPLVEGCDPPAFYEWTAKKK